MFVRATVLLSALLLTGGCGASSPAATDTLAIADGHGDMWKATTRMEPAPRQRYADIRRMVVEHTATDLVVQTEFEELEPRGAFVSLDVGFRTEGDLLGRASLAAGPHRAGGWSGRTSLLDSLDANIDCRLTHKIDYTANEVQLRVPRSCLGDPDWVQVRASAMYAPAGSSTTVFQDAVVNKSGFQAAWTDERASRAGT